MKLPFSPSVYEHAAALIGRSPWDVSRDPDLLFQAHAAARRLYGHDPVVVGIDIYNLEAEALGAVVCDPGGHGIPAVAESPCRDLAEALALPPFDPAVAGRVPLVLEVARRLHAQFPDADVRVPVSGPFSVAVSLRGIEGLLEDAVLHPAQVRDWLLRLAENQGEFCRAAVRRGLDIAFFESAAAPPLLSPAMFRSVELPALKRCIELAEAACGHTVPCIIGGDTTPILEDILGVGTGFVICPAETDQVAFLDKVRHCPEVAVRINLDPHTVAHGSKEAIARAVDRVLQIAQDRPNCLLGTGALPYETPPENVLFIRDYTA